MALRHYILKGREIVPVDGDTWSQWFETNERQIARDIIPGVGFVSTVFIGFTDQLFETMVFMDDGKHPLNQFQRRCDTYDEAIIQHKVITNRLWNLK